MNKLTAIFQVLQQGKALADAVRGKQWQLAFNAGGALLLGLLNFGPLFGIPVPPVLLAFITPEQITKASIVIGPLLNWWLTAASTDKINALGVPTPTPDPSPQSDEGPRF